MVLVQVSKTEHIIIMLRAGVAELSFQISFVCYIDKWFQDLDAFLGMVGEHRELTVGVRRIRRHGDSVISNGGV